jgi:hypothetical protein
MANRKRTYKYYFTVEGETELWYFQWLEKQINSEQGALRRVSFVCKKKDPLKNAKDLPIVQPTVVTHIFDYESNDPIHTARFATTLERMKKAGTQGKKISYKLGYSNFSFELWVVLHKADSFGTLTHRRQYLAPINRAFDEHFENLDQYKHEDNFKRVLRKLCLQDVKDAVYRARLITDKNYEYGYPLQNYKGYCYYRENPSLSIWESVARILSDCGLIKR